MENRNLIIAVVLSIAVMLGYSWLFPQPKKPLQQPTQTTSTTANQSNANTVNTAQKPSTTSTPAAPITTTSSASAPQGQVAAKDITVETDLYTVVISTDGGAIKKLALKRYNDVAGTGGKPYLLVNEDNAAGYTISSEIPGTPSQRILFSATQDSLKVTGSESKSLELVATLPNGLQLKRTFTFSGQDYSIHLDQLLSNVSQTTQETNIQFVLRNNIKEHINEPSGGSGQGFFSRRYMDVFGPAVFANNGVVFDKLQGKGSLEATEKSYDKGVLWSSFGDKYFLNAVLAKDNSIASVTLREKDGYLEQIISSAKFTLNPGQSINVPFKLYFGPKDIKILKAQGSDLEDAINFGWFSAIARPLLFALKFFYRYLGNYGLAIILLTVILKIIFFPLTNKSYKSMKAMQKLQPKMQELKEKYKDDREGLNRAVMELYRTNKVNPLGGCLPMLVQIPVFFGLYRALMYSVELRQAPFYFWIQDLSAKDPYYITPIIMGISMVIQQKMTPTTMDPLQAKMMLALPVVFTVMFLNFPSGLVLYWLVNNILTIAQQAYINKTFKEA
ncbi:MAG: membrane protein insertase YidC [Desulfuromonadales bacterium]|nr:membrane protein insertase YidC [Desulfuromonadales bacterium]